MNASAKWFRRALLGGVALGAMATAAQADELSALKAQLEALQSRVNSLEAAPVTSSGAPAGASFISFNRGSFADDSMVPVNSRMENDRGFTVAITPTADLPAPVMEVSVSGYVKADFIYDTSQNQGLSASPGAIAVTGGDDENFQAHARQSRFRIRSRSDTAVGQIRTLIEGDFFAAISSGGFRLRHAWGEWDVTPNITLGIGQSWSTHYHFAGEIPTVDFSGLLGTSGFNASRTTQFQVKSSSGPVSWAVALQNPRSEIAGGDDNQLPDLAAKANFDLLGGQVGISGIVKEIHIDAQGTGAGSNDSEIGWGVSAGIDLPLGDMITLHATAGYGDGSTEMTGSLAAGARNVGGNIRTNENYGWAVGASLNLSEASSINAAYSTSHASSKNLAAASTQDATKVHVNYMWQPVSKLRMGLEGIYSERELVGGADDDNIRIQFGTWFFF